MPILFVTGTDTAVGKTVVTGGIAGVLRAEGCNVGIMKPVVAGLIEHDGHLISEDVRFLETAAGIIEDHDLVAPYRLPLPAAPQLAAEHAGIRIDPARILRAAAQLARDCDLLLVEGAGGWLVPLSATYLMRDLAVDLRAAVLVVGRAGLGTINHTLLTVQAVQDAGLHPLGIVLNGRDSAAEDIVVDENPRLLAEQTEVPILGVLPLLPGVSVEQDATAGLHAAIERALDLTPIRDFAGGVSRDR